MSNQYWLIELEMLLVRFSHLGLNGGITSMGLTGLWGLFLHLSRMAGQ